MMGKETNHFFPKTRKSAPGNPSIKIAVEATESPIIIGDTLKKHLNVRYHFNAITLKIGVSNRFAVWSVDLWNF